MGLMVTEMKGLKKLHAAASPELLEKTLELRRHKFQKVLPDFMDLYSRRAGTGLIRYVEGVEGVREAMDMLLRDVQAGDDWVFTVHASGYRELLGEWLDDFSERRSRRSITLRGLFQDEPYARDYQQYKGLYRFDAKFLPPHVTINTSQSITPQHSLTVPLREPLIGILIDEVEVINTNRQMWEMVWASI
jgi:hypothetical protein